MISYSIKESEAIPLDQLVARLEQYGIHGVHSADADATRICITDGRNYLWCYGDAAVTAFARDMSNGHPGYILQSIADEFGVDIWNEQDTQYADAIPSFIPSEVEGEDISERIYRCVVSEARRR
jgi:hypothetical protein